MPSSEGGAHTNECDDWTVTSKLPQWGLISEHASTRAREHAHTNCCIAYLSVQASCDGNDVSCLVVNGEHVGCRALGILGSDLVAQHPIGCFGVVFVNRRYRHNKGP